MPARLRQDIAEPERLSALFKALDTEPAVALAVSGGADSLALLHLVVRWAESRPVSPRLQVYAVDHGLRPEAAAEVVHVLAIAQRLGVSARGLLWSGDKPAAGLQEAARSARYRLIGEAMAQDGIALLLTAHHQQDQAETILMRLAHKSGIEGLRGMLPFSTVEGVRVHRPLLATDPRDLADFLVTQGATPIVDPSNTDPGFERVRWRRAMPALEALGLDGPALSLFAQRMAGAEETLSALAVESFAELVRFDGFGAASLEVASLKTLPAAVASRLLARVLYVVGGRQRPHALGQIERLHRDVLAEILPRTTTLLGCIVRPRDEVLVIAREPGRAVPADMALPPHAEIVWDERFLIRNGSDERSLVAGVADFLPRHRLEAFLGCKVTTPAEAIRTAPIVRNGHGDVLSLGGWSFDDRVSVRLLVD